MAFQDVREFIEALESHGELKRIKQAVDWDVEAGAILRRCSEIGAPAPFFENIKEYPKGFNRLVGGLMAGSRKGDFRRVAIAMGLNPDIGTADLIEETVKRLNNPIKPIVVKTGPCKQNIMKGDDIDPFIFPVPIIHKGDGGRFIASWHTVVTKDLDSEWVNWGMYRSQIVTKRKLTLQVGTYRHLGMMYYLKYEPRKVPMPVAIAIGTDPLVAMATVTDLPPYKSEVDVAGGLRKEPVSLVKCETNDLYVPANSEIVIEGRCMPGERAEEGPHGEYTGYRVSERGTVERPLMRVDAITFRNNPIMTFSNMGMPIDDSHTTASLTQSAALLQGLREKGLPVKGLFVPPWGPWGLTIVSTRKPYAYVVHEIGAAIWSHPVGRVNHYFIALDETADPYDARSVLHEITFKCHPVRGIRKQEGGPGAVLDPYLTAYERHFNLGACVTLDCTAPFDWEFPPIESRFTNPHLYPEDMQKKVVSNWKKYGLEES